MHKYDVEWLSLGREPRVQLAEPNEKFGVLEIPGRPAESEKRVSVCHPGRGT
jgi:hypothetical protein